MVQVFIKSGQNGFESLEVSGHANSAPVGEDIVCAAVSAVTIGCLNNLKNPERFEIRIEKGFVSVRGKEMASDHDVTVLETLICGLRTIQEAHPEFIKIKNNKKGS